MSAQFIPIWSIASGSLFVITESVSASAQLTVQETFVTTVPAGTFQITLGPSAGSVISIATQNQSIGFHIDNSGQEVVFQPLPESLTLTIIRSTKSTFSLLNGELPPGLNLSSSGLIMGTPTNILPVSQTFSFTIRAQNEFAVRDRAFSITISGTQRVAAFNPATLPSTIVETQSQLTAYNIGSFKRGQSIWYSLDVIQPDFDIPLVSLTPINGLTETDSLANGFPDGVSLTDDLQIKGTVLPEALPGAYLIKFTVNDPITPSTALFLITILSDVVSTIDIPLTLVWGQPTGTDLGTIAPLQPCPLMIEALSNRSSIVYSLSPYSPSLPIGLTLDSASGEIRGKAYNMAGLTVPFVGRATLGQTFIEKDFTFELSSSGLTAEAARAYLLVDVPQTAIETAGISAALPGSMIFQPTNPDFGIQAQPTVTLVSGIADPGSLINLTAKDSTAIGNQGFYYTLTLVTGTLKSVSVNDSFGNPLYDVIVRPLFDPNVDAGGYILDELSNIVEQQVWYGQTSIARPVYINSIANIRFDLISHLGFATSDTSSQYRAGPSGPEILEPWMQGTYQLGFPLVYVQPGMGPAALKLLAQSTSVASFGDPLSFNMIFLAHQSGMDFIPLQ